MIILGLLIVAGVTIIGVTITTRLNDMSQNDVAVDTETTIEDTESDHEVGSNDDEDDEEE